MVCEIPSSLIAGFIKPNPVYFLSSISRNTLSSDLQTSLFLTPMGFFSSSTSSLQDLYELSSSQAHLYMLFSQNTVFTFHL